MTYSSNRNITKQRILDSAADLFSKKGYTETTVRELAESVSLNPASLYYHFPSKNTILECMLDDYSIYNTDIFDDQNLVEVLQKNPTTDGILACLQTAYPPERAEYYLKVLCVLLQEQLRNSFVRQYVCDHFILSSERNIAIVINVLKELGILQQDTDPDYWAKITSCTYYTFAARMMLGIGDNSPDFIGRSMVEMLKQTFDIMLDVCGTAKAKNTEPKQSDGQ